MIKCRTELESHPDKPLACTVCFKETGPTIYVLVEDGNTDAEQYACQACRDTFLGSEAPLPGLTIQPPTPPTVH